MPGDHDAATAPPATRPDTPECENQDAIIAPTSPAAGIQSVIFNERCGNSRISCENTVLEVHARALRCSLVLHPSLVAVEKWPRQFHPIKLHPPASHPSQHRRSPPVWQTQHI